MIPHDLEEGKIVGSLVFGPRMIKIKGNYDDVNRLCSQIADKYDWAIVNVNLRPFYTEGAKTHGFEIAEAARAGAYPSTPLYPSPGGTLLPKIYKAYQEFITLGLVEDNAPSIAIHACSGRRLQPRGPGHRARYTALQTAKTQNHCQEHRHWQPRRRLLRDQYRQRVRRQRGASANDQEILDAIKLLARTEGILHRARRRYHTCLCDQDSSSQAASRVTNPFCVCITGNGLKTIEVMQGQFAQSPVINAKMAEFDKIIEQITETSAETKTNNKGSNVVN